MTRVTSFRKRICLHYVSFFTQILLLKKLLKRRDLLTKTNNFQKYIENIIFFFNWILFLDWINNLVTKLIIFIKKCSK